jgi:hypothetical protein
VGFAPGHDIYFAAPGLKHRNRQRGGASKAEEAYAVSRRDPGNPQAAKPDNAGAEQWRYMGCIELGRKWIGEVFSCERKFSIPSVDGISSERRMVTEVFHAM